MPDFVIIGTTKGGTTALWEYLSARPDVFMPQCKEVQFFSNPKRWQQGVDWYAEHFADARVGQLVGEASPQYTSWPRNPDVPARMASVIPDAKLIYLVRDPVARTVSLWNDRYIRGQEKRPLAQAMRADRSYVESASYATQLARFLPYFDRKNIVVVQSERLLSDSSEAATEILRHLGVSVEAAAAEVPRANQGDRGMVRAPRGLLHRGMAIAAARLGADTARVDRLRWRLTTSIAPDTSLSHVDDADRAWLRARLRDDIAAFRAWMPSSFDGWGIA